MEIERLADNLGLDVEDMDELLDLYVETTSSDLEGLRAAISAGDAEEVDRKAHSIKGASGNLGLSEIYELATKIDDRARQNTLSGLDSMVQELSAEFTKLVQELKTSS